MNTTTLSTLYKRLLKFDSYGHPINVHFEGETTYKTWLGLICTLIVNAIFFETIIVLGRAFFSNSRQQEKAFVHKFDGFESSTYYLAENGVQFIIFPYFYELVYDDYGQFQGKTHEGLDLKYGKFQLTQSQSCPKDDIACLDSVKGFKETTVDF